MVIRRVLVQIPAERRRNALAAIGMQGSGLLRRTRRSSIRSKEVRRWTSFIFNVLDSYRPKLLLCILWHQHQPMYRHCGPSAGKGSFMLPWVRLYCIRDYYSMAASLTCNPNVHVTINLTPVLLRQIEAYGRCLNDGDLKDLRKQR